MRYFYESLQISAIFQVASSIKIILDIENKFVLQGADMELSSPIVVKGGQLHVRTL